MQELTPALKTIWNSLLVDILQKFISICKENNLTYFCIAGTAIGAVRHKGIIPWDDDIDVQMPRPDYDRFCKICEKSDLGDYMIVTPQNTADYPFNFIKLCNKNTTLVEHKDMPYVIGLFIDIFPLDGTADNIDEAHRLMQKYKKINNRLTAISTHNTFLEYISLIIQPKHWGRFVYKTIGFCCRKKYRIFLLKKLDNICNSHNYKQSKNVILYCGTYGRRNICPKEWFDGIKEFPFENIYVNLPLCYDLYLHQIYGDYMKLPPQEQRTYQHSKIYFNLYERETKDSVMYKIKKQFG